VNYRGTIKKGQVVLDQPAYLPEGTAVWVAPVEPSRQATRGSAAGIIAAVQPWDGPPGELERLLGDIQHLRDLDILPPREDLG